jgi:ankyrin repeat protein
MIHLVFDPATGDRLNASVTAPDWRKANRLLAWLFDPYSGARRSADQVASDCYGTWLHHRLGHWVTEGNGDAILEYLRTNNLPADTPADEYGNTCLGLALARRKERLIELLIAAGANVRARNAGGATILHTAAARGQPEVLKSLLGGAALADLEEKDETGSTPLIATSRGAKPIPGAGSIFSPTEYSYDNAPEIIARVEVLLAHGANVNAQNTAGRTLLMNAARYGYPPLVELLLQHGADARLESQDGERAVDFAGLTEIAELLVTGSATPPSVH